MRGEWVNIKCMAYVRHKMGEIIPCLNALIIFYTCCNKSPLHGWPKTTEIYSLMVLEV